MKLYHAPHTRSGRPRWLLEELGVPYELVRLDMSKGEHKSPEYLKIHPHGQVPALVDGDLQLIESAAICLYLADKYPEKKLAPAAGTAQRGLHYQWMVYSMTTLEPPVVQIFMHSVQLPEEKRSAATLADARKGFDEVARVLEQTLARQPYILGNEFSAADILIGSTLIWGQFMGLLEGRPVLAAYVARLSERPAAQRARVD